MTSQPSASGWSDRRGREYDDQTRLLNDRSPDYQATQEQYIRDHEEGLEKLGEAIKRQKYMANEIAAEVDVQNEIIDQIDDGMLRQGENIRKNTRNIRLVTKKSSTLFLWFLIVILAIAIVLLAIL